MNPTHPMVLIILIRVMNPMILILEMMIWLVTSRSEDGMVVAVPR